MLGRLVADPDGIEGPPGVLPGLGLLDVETRLTAEKRLAPATGVTHDGLCFHGYEMHMGRTDGADTARPFATLAEGRTEGARSADGRIVGTYVHGLFAADDQRSGWLTRLGGHASALKYEDGVEAVLDRLAAHLADHIDLDRLLALRG